MSASTNGFQQMVRNKTNKRRQRQRGRNGCLARVSMGYDQTTIGEFFAEVPAHIGGSKPSVSQL
jgi:hypothetical protein